MLEAKENLIVLYFLKPQQLAQARLLFQQLNIYGPETGDRFFESVGPGNVTFPGDRPYERFHDYEVLLQLLRHDNPAKYLEIHKGTAFYFLAWTAFQLKDYERAVFYMDAALTEDERKFPGTPLHEWLKNPSGQFLLLRPQGNQAAPEITLRLKNCIQREIERFGHATKHPQLTLESFIEKFVVTLAANKGTRSIVTALYVFVLEFEDRFEMLRLRSKDGGSIEPILTHLFKGGLILESLLKHLYPGVKTLGGFNSIGAFTADFCPIDTSALSLGEIVTAISGSDLKTAFDTTAKLRNTTGHSLIWDDVFNDPETFRALFNQVVNAILYVVLKKFL